MGFCVECDYLVHRHLLLLSGPPQVWLLLLPQLLNNNPTPVPGTCVAGLKDLAGCCVLVLLCCCGALAVAASTTLQQSSTCARNLYSWFKGSGWMLCACAALLLRCSTQRRLL